MSVVTDYLNQLNDVEKPILTRLRELVYELVPDAEDAFSYGIPTYRYKGKYMIGFASNKKFMSIYPGAEVISAFRKELAPYKLSKGTISFTVENPLPDELLRNIIQLCRDGIEQRVKKY
jgi:uncharacterized protein YdhG (YjbR/CyaY superfamily)